MDYHRKRILQQPKPSIQARASFRSPIRSISLPWLRSGRLGFHLYIFSMYELAIPRLLPHEKVAASKNSRSIARRRRADITPAARPTPQTALHQSLLHRQWSMEQRFGRP